MPGTKNRSGRRQGVVLSDAEHEVGLSYPRESDAATEQFTRWIVANLPMSGALPVDGLMIQTLAEMMVSQECVAIGLREDPSDLKLHRLRLQLAEKIRGYSSLLGLCAADRARLPSVEVVKEEDPFESLSLKIAGAG